MLSRIAALFKRNAPDTAAIHREGFGDGYTVGFIEGAKAGAALERERIGAIYALLPNPKHEAMLKAAMFDGVSTAPEVAQRAISAARKRAAFQVK